MGMATILVMWPGPFEQNMPWRLHMKFGFNRPSGFWEDDDSQSTRRTTDAYLSCKLTNEPLAQVS